MKHYHDPIKEEQRKALLQMILENLLNGRDSRNIKVLHFPGPDNLEWHQVYKIAGINPKNVIGLEENKKYYEELMKTNPEIDVKNMSLDKFMKQNPTTHFDIISLDYHNYPQLLNLAQSTKIIRNNDADRAIYHLAFLKQRDNKLAQSIQEVIADTERTQREVELERVLDTIKKLKTTHRYQKETPYTPENNRDTAVTSTIYKSLTTPINTLWKEAERILPELKIYLDIWNDELENSLEYVNDLKKTQNLERAIDVLMVSNAVYANIFRPLIKEKIIEKLQELPNTQSYIFKKDNTIPFLAQEIFNTILPESKEFREPRKITRYEYTSITGSPMLGDILFVEKDYKQVKARNELIEQIAIQNLFTNKQFVRNEYKMHMAGQKLIAAYQKNPELLLEQRYPKRIYLNDLVPGIKPTNKRKEETIDKKLNKKYQHNNTTTQKKEHNNIEKDKEEIIELYDAGFTTKEIKTHYENQYTTGQLAGIKKHITMGTYKKTLCEKTN
ncbi:hypothetical protein K9L97_04315 [Candidatus Woesearchaeota archaeon]|nr:hypothetical protein [Candidatus Woesearchaeota archaeon]